MGNLETKLTTPTPYYIITDSNSEYLNTLESNSIWLIKRANFNNECKNATLFEFNNHSHSKSDIKSFAANQIKTLKTLRHPNIVKYFYSEETPLINHTNHFKCLLITEYIRPLKTVLNNLSNEQIMHGLYGITDAINFLHDKVSMSHNNINESCIYLNSKQLWKLNNFELALHFSNMNKNTLRQIYDFKHKNSITPEEEDNTSKYDLDAVCKNYPHTIDAYGWAMCILNILPNESNGLEQLELFLSKDPTQRPTFEQALNLKIFDFNKPASIARKSFNPYTIFNLDDLEFNFRNLIDYLSTLPSDEFVNEKLIDFLLSPFMFFSLKVKQEIFPSLFIPKDVASHSLIDNFYFYSLNKQKQIDDLVLKPFLNLNNYKAFVIPRVLTLFSMRSTYIRLVLLEYFPFYVTQINDNDTLRYDVLPELLVGLKDKNDDIVSLTFSCLAIMAKLLGGNVVVGVSNGKQSERQSLFSDNLPKRHTSTFLDETKKLNSFASLDEEMMLLMMKKEENFSISESNQKLFSDSMIGLHEDTDDSTATNTNKLNKLEEDEDNWSNDFGVSWNVNERENKKETGSNLDLSSRMAFSSSNSTSSTAKLINDNFDQFDIKNIKLNPVKNKKEEDLIENFLNEMQPVIKKANTATSSNEPENKIVQTSLKMVPLATVNHSNWECDEVLDLDE